MQPRVPIEYVGGPACGQRTSYPIGPGGQPPNRATVRIPAVWASALDDKPVVLESLHLYERAGTVTTGEGTLWRYEHRGPAPR